MHQGQLPHCYSGELLASRVWGLGLRWRLGMRSSDRAWSGCGKLGRHSKPAPPSPIKALQIRLLNLRQHLLNLRQRLLTLPVKVKVHLPGSSTSTSTLLSVPEVPRSKVPTEPSATFRSLRVPICGMGSIRT